MEIDWLWAQWDGLGSLSTVEWVGIGDFWALKDGLGWIGIFGHGGTGWGWGWRWIGFGHDGMGWDLWTQWDGLGLGWIGDLWALRDGLGLGLATDWDL